MNNKGFTLIELLVVVLIIGILAAVALPQYTKAVERARMTEAVQKLGDLAIAESIYYMEQGSFAGENDIVNGDITFASVDTDSYDVTITAAADHVDIVAARKNGMFVSGDTKGSIGLRVLSTGAIEKKCIKNQNGFCAVAQGMGYGNGAEQALSSQ